MRKILFRGKCVDNGEWVYGGIVFDDEKVFIVKIIKYTPDTRDWDMAEYYEKNPKKKPEIIEVDPETVCMYTGLTDKNGKNIFEGDILSGIQYPYLCDGKRNYFAEVVWFENSPAFGRLTHVNQKANVRGISDGNVAYLEDFDSDDWEVIGNIFDNPELLERKV